jgi:ABC-type transport system substrate-binding protein
MHKKELLAIASLALLAVTVVPANAWVIPPNPPAEDNKYELYGPHVRGIIIQIYSNTTAEWQDMDAGQLDFEDQALEKTWIDKWTNPNNGQNFTVVNNGGQYGMWLLDINNNWTYTSDDSLPGIDNPTRDVHLRQALAYMVNRTWIVNDLLGGLGNAMWTPVPTYMKDCVNHDIYPGGAMDALTYGGWQGNLTQAAFILNTTGFPIDPSTGWRYWDKNLNGVKDAGEDLNLIFYSRQGQRGTFGDWYNNILTSEPIKIHTTYYSNKPRSDCNGPVFNQEYYSLYTGGWIFIGPDPDYLFYLYNGSNYYHPGAPPNYDGINDPILNHYLTGIQLATDPVAAGLACNMSQVRFATIAAAVPLWCTLDFKAYKNVPVEAGATGNWTHLVNQQGVGVNSWWSTLNMYQDGNLYPNNFTYYGFSSNVTLLNILYAQSYWDMEVLGRIYDSGAARDPITLASWVPQLFKYWTIGTWTDPATGAVNTEVNVTLRPDAYWQDNMSVTMADVNYTLVEISQDLIAKGLPPPWWYPTVQYISAVNIIDPYNAEILLNINSIWAAGYVIGSTIIPEHVWKPIVDASNTTNPIVQGRQPDPNIIGTGPFRWYSGAGDAPGTNVTLVANNPGSVVNGIASPGYYNYYPCASVSVDPSTLYVGPGQSFNISIRVSNVRDLYLWVFSIQWNPATLEYISITEGGFLRNGSSTTGILIKSVNRTGGYLEAAACSRLGNVPGVNGSGILANITFRAKAPGSSLLDMYFVGLLDSNLSSIPSTIMNGYVYQWRIPGDTNGDNQVTYIDLGTLCIAYWSTPADSNWNPSADLNHDGVVDYKDLALLSQNYSS